MPNDDQEIGGTISVSGIETNYHDHGDGRPVLLLHGSGPGVSAWANWRMTIPCLSNDFRVVAPDIVGFGFTARPDGFVYDMPSWVSHAIGFLDALSLQKVSIVGNSFGGALALALTVRAPARIDKLVLMGSAGVDFALTEGLDKIWGYTPSLNNMKELLGVFAYNRSLVTDELANLRYRAGIRPGVQETYEKMFPPPRQKRIEAIACAEKDIRAIDKKALIIHGREDLVIPKENAYKLFSLIEDSQLHIFGKCGHWTQIEQSTRFNRLVGDFLRED